MSIMLKCAVLCWWWMMLVAGETSDNQFQLQFDYDLNLIIDKIELRQLIQIISSNANSIVDFFKALNDTEQPEDNYIHERPEGNMTTVELIEKMGYKAESHNVTTEDGYTIEIHRIPSNASAKEPAPPVLLQHGLFGCSSTWVVNYPNQSLGFMLADAGYDVWLSNIRGSPYGKYHRSLDLHSKEFWNFSFEEAAVYDLSAVIDYVLNISQQTQVQYVGHSMGTTMAFVLLSTKQQYNQKIKMMYALAPVAYLHHMHGTFIRILAHLEPVIKEVMSFLPIYWFPLSDAYSPALDVLCQPNTQLCTDIMEYIIGSNLKQINQSRILVYIHQFTKLTSIRTLLHYAQIIKSKQFRRYDWGFLWNLKTYGQFKPPSYGLESITTPTVFYCSFNDILVSMEDVELLVKRLPQHLHTDIIDDPLWNHLDFVTSINDGPVINKRIINWMKSVENRV